MITCAKCRRPQGLAFGTGYALPAADGGLGSAGDGKDWFCSEACHPLAPFPTEEELEKALATLDPVERLVRLLYDRNPAALLLGYEAEEVEAFKAALVGITDDPHGEDAVKRGVQDHWPRESGAAIAVYSASGCVEVLVRLSGHSDPEEAPEQAWADAEEWFGFNTSGAYNGPGTPCFLYDPERAAGWPQVGDPGEDTCCCCEHGVEA